MWAPGHPRVGTEAALTLLGHRASLQGDGSGCLLLSLDPNPCPQSQRLDMPCRGTLCPQRASEPGPRLCPCSPGGHSTQCSHLLPPRPLAPYPPPGWVPLDCFLQSPPLCPLSGSQPGGSSRARSFFSVIRVQQRVGVGVQPRLGLGAELLASQGCYGKTRKAPGACPRALWTNTSWGWRTRVGRPPPATGP